MSDRKREEEIARIEQDILLGELSDDLFYVSGRGRELRKRLIEIRKEG